MLGTERGMGSKEEKREKKKEGREEGRREREGGKSIIPFPITQSLTVGHTYLSSLPLCPSHNYVTFSKLILSQTVLDIAPILQVTTQGHLLMHKTCPGFEPIVCVQRDTAA